MIYIKSPIVLPLVVLILSIDVWLWLASIRLILGKAVSVDYPICNVLRRLTDPLPEHLTRILAKWNTPSLPHWAPWLMTFVGLMVLRHTLFQLIIALQNR